MMPVLFVTNGIPMKEKYLMQRELEMERAAYKKLTEFMTVPARYKSSMVPLYCQLLGCMTVPVQ